MSSRKTKRRSSGAANVPPVNSLPVALAVDKLALTRPSWAPNEGVTRRKLLGCIRRTGTSELFGRIPHAHDMHELLTYMNVVRGMVKIPPNDMGMDLRNFDTNIESVLPEIEAEEDLTKKQAMFDRLIYLVGTDSPKFWTMAFSNHSSVMLILRACRSSGEKIEDSL